MTRVSSVIDQEIQKAERDIAELSLKRDVLESSRRAVQDDLEYAQVLMGFDRIAKEKKKTQLLERHKAAKIELEELKQLVSDEEQSNIQDGSTQP